MKRFCIRLTIAVLAFGCGLAAHKARINLAHVTPSPPPRISRVLLPSERFEATRIIDMFMEDYRRASDGATVRFGCFEQASAAEAMRRINSSDRNNVVEVMDFYDVYSAKVGERVVRVSGASSFGTVIEWNEGSRLFVINASSLRDAKIFESSRVWSGGVCWDPRPFLNRS